MCFRVLLPGNGLRFEIILYCRVQLLGRGMCIDIKVNALRLSSAAGSRPCVLRPSCTAECCCREADCARLDGRNWRTSAFHPGIHCKFTENVKIFIKSPGCTSFKFLKFLETYRSLLNILCLKVHLHEIFHFKLVWPKEPI